VLRLVNDAVCFASSLIHWFKLVVDSTPSYKNGIQSIYAAAIYDIPRDVCPQTHHTLHSPSYLSLILLPLQLGAQTIELARIAILAINAPNSPEKLDLLKNQANKVMAQIIRAEGYPFCSSFLFIL
jgi:hypothetical protein